MHTALLFLTLNFGKFKVEMGRMKKMREEESMNESERTLCHSWCIPHTPGRAKDEQVKKRGDK